MVGLRRSNRGALCGFHVEILRELTRAGPRGWDAMIGPGPAARGCAERLSAFTGPTETAREQSVAGGPRPWGEHGHRSSDHSGRPAASGGAKGK